MRLWPSEGHGFGYNPHLASATAAPPGPANRDTSARLATSPQGQHSKYSPNPLAFRGSHFTPLFLFPRRAFVALCIRFFEV